MNPVNEVKSRKKILEGRLKALTYLLEKVRNKELVQHVYFDNSEIPCYCILGHYLKFCGLNEDEMKKFEEIPKLDTIAITYLNEVNIKDILSSEPEQYPEKDYSFVQMIRSLFSDLNKVVNVEKLQRLNDRLDYEELERVLLEAIKEIEFLLEAIKEVEGKLQDVVQ